MVSWGGSFRRLVVVRAVAQEEKGQHVVAEVVRIHGPAQLVGDAPEGVAQLLLVGVGHADRKLSRLIGKLRCNADHSAHGGVVWEVFGF